MSNTFKILMYSHDTYGLGHIRRTLAIASQLRRPNVNILILTGSPIVGRFDFPEQVDFVRIPGMIKKSNDLYLPHSIRIEAQEAMNIRQSIIKATAKAFEPDLFIVDKAPLGLKREVIPALKWLRNTSEVSCRTVLGLRDIMDDAHSTIEDWRNKRVYDALEKYYSEIWVYGHREMYDPIKEYEIPESISQKMVFTGYLPRKPLINGHDTYKGNGMNGCGTGSNNDAGVFGAKEKRVLVTTGGGGDGYKLMDVFLRMLETWPAEHRSVVVTGPFMPTPERKDIAARARKLGVRYYHFCRQMEQLMAAADLVVSMGGYNTICEILSQRKVSLIVPRETPRLEQLIRAQVLKAKGLADYLAWQELTPDRLRSKIEELLINPQPYVDAVQGFRFTGLEVMRQRLAAFQAGVV
jgi:predicted glycosyltransferase